MELGTRNWRIFSGARIRCRPANVQATTATSRSSNSVVQPSGQNIIEFEVMGSQLMGSQLMG